MDEKIIAPAFYTVPVYMDGELIAKFYGTYEVLDALLEMYRTAYTNDTDDRYYIIFMELNRIISAIDDEDF